jgi:hypothetical protein
MPKDPDAQEEIGIVFPTSNALSDRDEMIGKLGYLGRDHHWQPE